jgi:hypothetical protein
MAKARTPRTPKPKAEKVEKTEKKVLQMPDAPVSAGSSGNIGSNGNSRHSSVETESEIRRRAYELYADRGYTDGLHEQDWLEAERQVLSRNAQKHTA